MLNCQVHHPVMHIVHIHTKYISIPSTSSCQLYIFMPSTSLYQVHIHTKYTSQCTYSYQVYLLAKYTFIPSTLYVSMPSISLCHVHCIYSYQVHLQAKYTSSQCTSSYQVHLHIMYILPCTLYIFMPSTLYIFMLYTYFIPSTSLCPLHLKYILHIHAKYIFLPSTPSYQIHCTYSYQLSTPSSQVHIYGTGGWHPAAGHIRGAWSPHGCLRQHLLTHRITWYANGRSEEHISARRCRNERGLQQNI